DVEGVRCDERAAAAGVNTHAAARLEDEPATGIEDGAVLDVAGHFRAVGEGGVHDLESDPVDAATQRGMQAAITEQVEAALGEGRGRPDLRICAVRARLHTGRAEHLRCGGRGRKIQTRGEHVAAEPGHVLQLYATPPDGRTGGDVLRIVGRVVVACGFPR